MKEMENLKGRISRMAIEKTDIMMRKHDTDSFKRFAGIVSYFADVFGEARSDFTSVYDLMERLRKSLSSKESVLLVVFLYLLAAEGLICQFLNYVSYVLVTNGHDLYSQTKRRYVKDDMDEIRKVEMSTKIQFLKHHGFGALTKEDDSTFRNDIAHHNYKVDEKGVLWVRGHHVDLGSKIEQLGVIIRFMTESLHETNEKIRTRIRGLEELLEKGGKMSAD